MWERMSDYLKKLERVICVLFERDLATSDHCNISDQLLHLVSNVQSPRLDKGLSLPWWTFYFS